MRKKNYFKEKEIKKERTILKRKKQEKQQRNKLY